VNSASGFSKSYVAGRFGQMHLRLASPASSPQRVTDARPILCFHLSPVSGVIYERFIAEMGRDRLAVAPDTPGYGASDAPPAPPDIADYAAAMGDVMDALGIVEADCIGYHTGSKIALELALQRPAAIRHLLLVAAPVYTDDELTTMRAEFAPLQVRADGGHLVEYWNALRRWRGPGQTDEMLMGHYPDHMRGGEHRHWGHRAAFRYAYPEKLPQAMQPVLVLNPNDDLVQYTPRAAQYLRHGRVLDLPNWGHGFLDLHTTGFASLVRAFCDRDEFPVAPP
jgi:pimeloyl-ACP methyl ester carboxylesterase